MGLELGVLLADDRRLAEAGEAIRSLAREPSGAALFLMDDGARAASAPLMMELLEAGVEVALCAADAEARGVLPVDGGPRFGSQYDHAVMVRDARRVVALTGDGHRDDHAPPAGAGRRVVRVRLTRDVRDGKTAQALRSAVGYAACDLDVVIAVEPPARAILDALAARSAVVSPGSGNLPQGSRLLQSSLLQLPEAVLRAVGTLRGLGHRIAPASDAPPGHLEVTW
ncbi:MAG TPA: hypothetical protein VFF06_28120 [Polyangia bacterium]|nr:hypothetical protein [Polyangia bacterium]